MTLFGHEFRDDGLINEALTTPACRMDHPGIRDNQRLEFLGDAVLGLLAAQRLYAERPREAEGSLTVERTHMVSSAALCAAAARHGLVAQLRRNRGAEALSPNAKTLADAVEAVIGAAYLEGGLAAAQEVFDALELPAHAGTGAWSANPKGDLQIRAQAMTPPRHPEYRLVRVTGKSHEPTFTVEVTVEGLGCAEASAGNRREAEASAAARLLEKC